MQGWYGLASAWSMLNKTVTAVTANGFKDGELRIISGTPTLQASNPLASHCVLYTKATVVQEA